MQHWHPADDDLKQRDDPWAPQDRSPFAALKAAIVGLDLAPGSLLQEGQVGDLFGVSRTPAREILRDLMAEGLVTRSGRFYRVRTYDPEEIRVIYEVREGLECLSGRLATERATDRELRELRVWLDREAERARDGFYVGRHGPSVHLRIAALARNELLLQQLRSLHDKVEIISRINHAADRRSFSAALTDHERIVDAMLRRAPSIVEEEIRFHVRAAIRIYQSCFAQSHPDPA